MTKTTCMIDCPDRDWCRNNNSCYWDCQKRDNDTITLDQLTDAMDKMPDFDFKFYPIKRDKIP